MFRGSTRRGRGCFSVQKKGDSGGLANKYYKMTEPKIQLFGIKELDDFFQKMKIADQRKIFIDSWRIGSKPLITLARSLLKSKLKTRSTTRNLEKSVGFVAGRNRGKTVFISSKVGARKFGSHRGFHGHLYDAGTKDRQTKQGFSRGQMPKSNFFTDAFRQTESQMINSSQNNILKGMDKLIQRNLKKLAKNN